ncbi:hypothetical protein MFLO_02232 [Listeria floridensis FSL S10-1187]|uniref:Uncharacterized protein n=1 Tax=Listeria floridensis FSL S10-1187 TaxID=1265817 RepID=A0ABN0RI10_9LIST|nr:hypothetical protein MFLO_02232 [Listeria floridensis FSL S10-1187]
MSEIIPQKDYLETDGPLICKGDLRQLVRKPTFSFFMRDAGMQEILAKLVEMLGKQGRFLL